MTHAHSEVIKKKTLTCRAILKRLHSPLHFSVHIFSKQTTGSSWVTRMQSGRLIRPCQCQWTGWSGPSLSEYSIYLARLWFISKIKSLIPTGALVQTLSFFKTSHLRWMSILSCVLSEIDKWIIVYTKLESLNKIRNCISSKQRTMRQRRGHVQMTLNHLMTLCDIF